MKVSFLIICLVITTSCSSMKSSIVYGSLSGAAVGAGLGYGFSPDKDSDVFNAAIWGAVGAFIGAGVGYLLNADDPDNQEMKQMIRPDKMNPVPLRPLQEDFGFQLIKPTESKSYEVPSQNIPERLKNLVKKQIITEHIIGERVEKKENGKTIVYPETKVYEYDFE